jgi:tetratricopeptide (TPR) repeat protein
MEILAKRPRFKTNLTLKIEILVLSFLIVFISIQSAHAQDILTEAFRESYSLEKSQNFNGAIDRLKSVYQSNSYELNLRLGWLHFQSSKLDQSLEYYTKAVDLKPYAIEPKLGLVLPLSVLGKWEEILEIYHQILQTDPQNSLINYRVGLIYYNKGEFAKADPFLEKVVNLYPFDYDGLLLLGWNKLSLQKTREAKVLFQKVLLNNPGDESALEGLKLIK